MNLSEFLINQKASEKCFTERSVRDKWKKEEKKRVFSEEVVGNSGWISKKTAIQLNLIILAWFPSFPEQNGIRLIDKLNSTPRKELGLTGNNQSFGSCYAAEGTFPFAMYPFMTIVVFTQRTLLQCRRVLNELMKARFSINWILINERVARIIIIDRYFPRVEIWQM